MLGIRQMHTESLPLRFDSAPEREARQTLRTEVLAADRWSHVLNADLLEQKLRELISSGGLLSFEIRDFLEHKVTFGFVHADDLPNPHALLVARYSEEQSEILVNSDLLKDEALYLHQIYKLTFEEAHYLLALALLPSIAQDGSELVEIQNLRRVVSERLGMSSISHVPQCSELEFLGLLAHAETAIALRNRLPFLSKKSRIPIDALQRVFTSPALGVLSQELIRAQQQLNSSAGGLSGGQGAAAYKTMNRYYREEFSALNPGDWKKEAQRLAEVQQQIELLIDRQDRAARSDVDVLTWASISGISPTGLQRLSESISEQREALTLDHSYRIEIQRYLMQRLQQSGSLTYFLPASPPPPLQQLR